MVEQKWVEPSIPIHKPVTKLEGRYKCSYTDECISYLTEKCANCRYRETRVEYDSYAPKDSEKYPVFSFFEPIPGSEEYYETEM